MFGGLLIRETLLFHFRQETGPERAATVERGNLAPLGG